jgi:hypothetical protein
MACNCDTRDADSQRALVLLCQIRVIFDGGGLENP